MISKENKSVESNGYYERVPIRVGEFTLNENSENKLVFETTAQEFCNSGPKIILKITNGDSGWSVQRKQGTSMDMLVPSVNLTTDKLERRRAFWHAAQYMVAKSYHIKKGFQRFIKDITMKSICLETMLSLSKELQEQLTRSNNS